MAIDVFEDHSPDVDIMFTKEDLKDVVPHDNDPVVVSLVTAGRKVPIRCWWTKEARQM